MKIPALIAGLALCLVARLTGADTPAPRANLVVLDAIGLENLRLQTAVAERGDFEETVFALGRIETKPGNVAAVSSQISGRVAKLSALPGDRVPAGGEVMSVESRQPGDPRRLIGLTTPLAGIVTRLDVRLGNPVEPDRALLEISNLSEVLAVARVPENAAGRMQPGATAHITVSALAHRKFEGRLLRFGTTADPTSGTLDAIFLLPNADDLIRPGMRAEFSIVIAKRSDVTLIPRSALQGDPSDRFVYVKDFDLPNAFLKTPVVVGQANDRFVEIVRGLLPADEVVTQGGYSLAFAGTGTLSLKAALDAAHGHEHNADGSELTAEQRKKAGAAVVAPSDHEHEHSHGSPFWMIVSGILFVLLIVVSARRKRDAASPRDPASSAAQSD